MTIYAKLEAEACSLKIVSAADCLISSLDLASHWQYFIEMSYCMDGDDTSVIMHVDQAQINAKATANCLLQDK